MVEGGTLVTGAAGFVGSWLVPALRAAGHDVIGARLPGEVVRDPEAATAIPWLEADLRVADEVDALLRRSRPARIVHLAAVALPAAAADAPLEALRGNVAAVLHLVEATARHAPAARLLLVSTGAIYAATPVDAAPRDEQAPIAPPNVYAATKAAAETLAVRAARERDVALVRARPFNHTGPGRPPGYAESSFARQLVAIERGEQDGVLRVGNLEAVRDFSDVRDVADAYLVLLERGEPGAVYNVCSGRGRSIRQVLDALLASARASPRVEVDPARYRPEDPTGLALVGDASRLRALGWTPRRALEATLAELLDYWRACA